MANPWLHRKTSSNPMLSEEALRKQLAYCKARLTDIDNAPHHSRHRQDRDRVIKRISRFEAVLERIRQSQSQTRVYRS